MDYDTMIYEQARGESEWKLVETTSPAEEDSDLDLQLTAYITGDRFPDPDTAEHSDPQPIEVDGIDTVAFTITGPPTSLAGIGCVRIDLTRVDEDGEALGVVRSRYWSTEDPPGEYHDEPPGPRTD